MPSFATPLRACLCPEVHADEEFLAMSFLPHECTTDVGATAVRVKDGRLPAQAFAPPEHRDCRQLAQSSITVDAMPILPFEIESVLSDFPTIHNSPSPPPFRSLTPRTRQNIG